MKEPALGPGVGWAQGLRYGALGFPLAFVALPLYVVLPNHYAVEFGVPLGVLGALLLSWTNAAFAAGDAARPGPGATPLLRQGPWGNAQMPLVDATPGL